MIDRRRANVFTTFLICAARLRRDGEVLVAGIISNGRVVVE